jgi:hypothetical protein
MYLTPQKTGEELRRTETFGQAKEKTIGLTRCGESVNQLNPAGNYDFLRSAELVPNTN